MLVRSDFRVSICSDVTPFIICCNVTPFAINFAFWTAILKSTVHKIANIPLISQSQQSTSSLHFFHTMKMEAGRGSVYMRYLSMIATIVCCEGLTYASMKLYINVQV